MHEYTDVQGLKLRVQSRNNYGWDCVEIGAHTDDGTFWRAFKVEEAPTLALAILEAAGIDYERYVTMPPASDDIDELCACAAQTLRLAVRQRANKAEREAEDAKVREFRESSMAAIAHVFKESNNDSKGWDGLSEEGREGWRARYRAARKFFEVS